MTLVFILPSEGNTITRTDIDSGRLRITSDYKSFFPTSSTKAFVRVGDISKTVSFQFREDRSHVLQIGHELMEKLKLSEGDRICIEVLEDNSYRISKLTP